MYKNGHYPFVRIIPISILNPIFYYNIISDKIHLFFHTIFLYDFLLSV